MTLQVFNTLTRTKESFVPLKPKEISFYLCGPTVYNYIHIGNARSAVAFDTIRRYLEFKGFKVNYVSNFTDVDDKIIQAAQKEDISPKELADKYIEAYQIDTQAINILPASSHPRVMENIDEIIQFIQVLIDKGVAYSVEGDVYFKTSSFSDYGRLSDQNLSALKEGASLRLNQYLSERKHDALDFALWKSAKEGEIAWQSPWGLGRPGWHIECSVMATKYLGDTIDLHAGGQDLQFPHHENEIAQSECATGKTFARYWLHNGFVTMGSNQEKMSKSLGNFILLRDLLKEYDPMVIRYLLASVHYRRPLQFDQDALDEAQINYQKIQEVFRRLKHRQADALREGQDETAWIEQINESMASFIKEMDNDFQISNSLTAFFEMIKITNRYLDQEQVLLATLNHLKEKLEQVLYILGITLTEDIIDDEIQALIDQRTQARHNRDFAQADAIREQLKNLGILLDDTPQGTTWKRI